MKLRLNLTRIGLVLVILLGGLHTASAFYDPSLQRWLNRDPLGDSGGLAYLLPPLDHDAKSDDASEMPGDELLASWTQVNLNLHAFVANNGITSFDPFGLEGLDSPSACMNSAIARGSSQAIRNLLDTVGEDLSPALRQAAQNRLKQLGSKAGDLIRGSLKGSRSYHSELENKTYEELLKDSSKAAKQMRKLIEQSERLMEKTCKK